MSSSKSHADNAFPWLPRRSAGVLLHPTSLPGPQPWGQVSHDAYRFVEFLAAAGMRVWQTLPLSATHPEDGSPYNALSAHACEPRLISLDWLSDRALLPVESSRHGETHAACLEEAFARFAASGAKPLQRLFNRFCREQAGWLEEYVLFMAVREQQGGRRWQQWDEPLRLREEGALRQLARERANRLEYHRFLQFIFFSQWTQLRDYAHSHGVALFGDLPIYVALDSADVWANQSLFLLDAAGRPTRQAGVPPDYFSASGQLWGNPLYDWAAMKRNDFAWWRRRLQTQLQLFDLVRIDHFRGLQAFWSIPAGAESALEGHWEEAPGAALLAALRNAFGALPLVAEDLGLITEEVHTLRRRFDLPGMKVFQFGFDGDPANIHLPHSHEPNAVVYSGTHDNDTTLAWYRSLPPATRDYVRDYLGLQDEREMPWPVLRQVLASVAHLAILPMQDLLALGEGQRMNTPGVAAGNWQWRFDWEQLPAGLAGRLAHLSRLYNR